MLSASCKAKKVKLCDSNDPEATLIWFQYYLDEDVINFMCPYANFKTAQDVLEARGYNEKGEKLSSEAIPGFKAFIVKTLEGETIGRCSLKCLKDLDGIDFSFWVGKPFWGNGFAIDAAKVILNKFYEDKITASFILGARVENTKSLRAHEKGAQELGFGEFAIGDGTGKRFTSEKYCLKLDGIINFEIELKIDEKNPELIDITRQRDEAIRTKALIGSRREATAMATASHKSREVERLKMELDRSREFASIKAVEIKTKRKFEWRLLRNYCNSHELEMPKIFDSNYGSVRTYPAKAWKELYEIRLGEIFSNSSEMRAEDE